jgi:hypothetical protein
MPKSGSIAATFDKGNRSCKFWALEPRSGGAIEFGALSFFGIVSIEFLVLLNHWGSAATGKNTPIILSRYRRSGCRRLTLGSELATGE